jgi:DNA-directed RNA polymerase subunit N (RpoN/RPB10)
MALIKCADCGREVSDAASTCLGCGRPIAAAVPRKRRRLPRWSKWLLTLGMLIGALCGAAYVFRNELMPVPACVDPDVLRVAEQLVKERVSASNQRLLDGREQRFDPLTEMRHCSGRTVIGSRSVSVEYFVQWADRLEGTFLVNVTVAFDAFEAVAGEKLKADAIDQYNIARRSGSRMDRCVGASNVALWHLQAKDQRGYEQWKRIEKEDCRAAGVPQ